MVVLVPPDPTWAERFAEEARRLREVLGETLLVVHHVGSTSVGSIWAKPIVDLMPLARALAEIDAARAALEAAGWVWRGEYGIPGRRYLVRHEADGRTHRTHVHIYEPRHHQVARQLAFRDHLRAHPDAAAAAYEDAQARMGECARHSRVTGRKVGAHRVDAA